jgi:predicted metal-dependent enzyme (double-stranded beta helix superfamily)
MTGMTISALPAGHLTEGELAELAETVAACPDLWSGQVDHADGQRHFASIHRDEYVDVWLICWSAGNDTGWHDHDGCAGAVRVVRGAITESRLRIGGVPVQTVVTAGCSFSFGPDHIHRLTGAAEQSISLHAYSPPLRRVGQYIIDEAGVMHRVSAGYADELRPLGPRSPVRAA